MTPPRPDGGWASLPDDELRAELEARGLDAEGSSEELAARLDEADAAAPSAPTGGGAGPAAGDDAPAAAAAPEGEATAAAGEEEAPAAVEDAPDDEETEGGDDAPDDEETEGGEDAPDDEEAEGGEDAPEREAEGGDDAPEADAPAAGEPGPPARRRGAAETSTATPRRPPPRRPDGSVVVRARAKYVRSAPRKARLVMEHIRGRPVEQARAILVHTPRSVSADVLKLLNSAVANAESNHELAADELRVQRAYVDEGPTIKRYRPRALGRATRIHKRTSHMTIELTTAEQGRR